MQPKIVNDLIELDAINNPKNFDVVFVTDKNTHYKFVNGLWHSIKYKKLFVYRYTLTGGTFDKWNWTVFI